MNKVTRGLKGIAMAALASSLVISFGVSADISRTNVDSVDVGIATTIMNMQNALAVTPFKAKQPMTVADGCWVYINGYWIRVCNHDVVPVNKI